MRIEKLNYENIDKAIEVTTTPFDIIGRIIPSYVDDKWSFKEELSSGIFQKKYKIDLDYDSYIDNSQKMSLVVFDENECVGVAFLHRHWNNYCYVDNIHVVSEKRGNGVGKILMDAISDLAKEKGLYGVMLETQDNNVYACRFYAKYGMKIGGVDCNVYSAFPHCSDEKAIYWYKNIRKN